MAAIVITVIQVGLFCIIPVVIPFDTASLVVSDMLIFFYLVLSIAYATITCLLRKTLI